MKWTAPRKAEVVRQIRTRTITREEACAAYEMSPEEIDLWCRAYAAGGVKALRTNTLPAFR
jgi:transposase-like protein